MAKQDNTDLKKVLFEEVLEEIEEEFQDSLADLIVEEHLNKIITDVQEAVKAKIKKLIENSDVEKMDDTQKLILGEKITRVVSKEAKIK